MVSIASETCEASFKNKWYQQSADSQSHNQQQRYPLMDWILQNNKIIEGKV